MGATKDSGESRLFLACHQPGWLGAVHRADSGRPHASYFSWMSWVGKNPLLWLDWQFPMFASFVFSTWLQSSFVWDYFCTVNTSICLMFQTSNILYALRVAKGSKTLACENFTVMKDKRQSELQTQRMGQREEGTTRTSRQWRGSSPPRNIRWRRTRAMLCVHGTVCTWNSSKPPASEKEINAAAKGGWGWGICVSRLSFCASWEGVLPDTVASSYPCLHLLSDL